MIAGTFAPLTFEFVVGDAVPRAEWSEHALAAGSFQNGDE